jgi:predicted DNA-binding WGR domain protein
VKQKSYILTLLTLAIFSCGTDNSKTTENSNTMLKLYKLIDNQLHYWETWDKDEKTAIVHWGVVGQRGQDKEVKGGLFSNFRKTVQKEIDEKIKEGYTEFDEDKVSFLEIEYKIDGFGTEQDLDKRHRLEGKLDEILGWTGLGHTDGGSIGSGTMEAGCIVVDFDIAKNVIEEKLKDTEFADFTRIYKMENE